MGVTLLCQAYIQWNTSRKVAYFSIGAAVFIFICAIAAFLCKKALNPPFPLGEVFLSNLKNCILVVKENADEESKKPHRRFTFL